MIKIKNATKVASLLSALVLSAGAQATIVEFQTSQQSFKVNLYDTQVPETVANFLKYVEANRYDESVLHRAIPQFIIQGGGIGYDAEDKLANIETFAAVKNEPKYSNVRGTISMAKIPNSPNSATSQWFINVKDNSAELDVQNSGYTVFGEVIDSGMNVVDQISGLTRCGEVPVINFSDEQCSNADIKPAKENLVVVYSVKVLDNDPNTAASLSPKENTLIKNVEKPSTDNGSSSGGSLYFALLMLASSVIGRRFGRA